MMKVYDYAIIGAGISGLSSAYYILKKDPAAKIIFIEKADYVGGKIKSEFHQNFLVEAAPDCFLTRKKGAVELCEELGILKDLIGRIPQNNKTYVKSGNRLYPLPAGITGLVPTDFSAIEACEFISEEGRERFRQEPSIPVLKTDTEESIAQFMSRRFGQEIYEKLIEPLMAGIYGGDGSQLSLHATFPKLREMEIQYGSVINGLNKNSPPENSPLPPFASFPNGMSTLVEALQEKLKAVEILLNHTVLEVEKTDSYYIINAVSKTSEPKMVAANNIIFACEAHASAKILKKLSPILSTLHEKIPYGSSLLVNFAFNKSDIDHLPESYGYVIPRIENSRILACTFTSQKWPNRAKAHQVLIRVYMNRYNAPDVLSLSDDQIIELALEELSSTIGLKSKPIFTKIFRWAQSMPQYVIGHQAWLSEIQKEAAKYRGLKFVGAAYQGVGIPDCILSAR
jgi:oxygen-dependent protoporphyrinogen oxidase